MKYHMAPQAIGIALLAATVSAACSTATKSSEPRGSESRPGVELTPMQGTAGPAPALGVPADAAMPAPGRLPRPLPTPSQPVACASTQQCGPEQICTTETGDCARPPGCGPSDICTAVCWGHCAAREGRAPAAKGVRCGKKVCAAGQVCCNPSCGICTPPGGFCTKQYCGEPGGPRAR
jgi:hypothetical protein